MLEVIKRYPHLLGIGIDVNTSILVQGAMMTVFGNSYVAVYDFQSISEEIEHTYLKDLCLLRHGQRYDLLSRKIVS